MAKYTKEMQAAAREKGWSLATIAVAGIEFSGPVTPAEQKEIVEFWLAFQNKRADRLKADATAGGA